jgi:hypothetical protein
MHRIHRLRSLVILFAAVLLVPVGTPIAASAAAASVTSVTVFIRVLDSSNENAITDACFTIVNASNEGCDANGDGYIFFADMAPGTYTVTQTKSAAGYVDSGDFQITVNSDAPQQVFPVFLTRQGSGNTDQSGNQNGGTADISIVALDPTIAVSVPGACFIIGNVSNEGCDENNDGQVTFADVPTGTYLVHETKAPAGYAVAPDQWIVVAKDGPIIFFQGGAADQSGNQTQGLVHVSLVTRNPKNADLLTGACYIIQNASIEGCDENGDGQVDFADVTPGEYTVHQTKTPSGFPTVADFKILITRVPTQSFPIYQRAEQINGNHRNVSIVLVDKATGDRISGGNACIQIVGVSNIGCDENGDGQVDFIDIPVGKRTVKVTSLPAGYGVDSSSYELDIDPNYPYSIVTAAVPLDHT